MNQGVMVGGRRPWVEDDLWWKTPFGGRRSSVEDDLWWKKTYSGRRPSVEENFWGKTILACCLVRFAAFFKLWLGAVKPLSVYPKYFKKIKKNISKHDQTH